MATSNFTVSANGGFVAPDGQQWTMRGLNAGVQDALQGFGNVLIDYPGLTTIRLNTGGNDSAADIDKVVQEYTARGVVVMLEDHSGNANNVAWYTQMATTYKGNSLVFLEMPNEPNGTNLSQIQIGLVNAIRAAGFTNPIALQPVGGYDFSNIAAVTAAVGTNNIFITPHIYYGGTDPNGAAQYVAADISTSLNLGLFPAIDEFGDAMDGWNRDPFGAQVISSMITANEAGKAGAVFWAMDNGNHPNGADSAFLNTSGTQLTPVGQTIQPWLSQPITGGGGTTGGGTTQPPALPAPVVTGTGPDSLVLAICEDFYQGDAQFTVSIDGKQVGGTFTAGAWHSAGQEQLFTFNGTFVPGNHTLNVAFLNDAWGGSALTDRNLYVDSIKFDGTDTKQSVELGGTGSQTFTFVGTPLPPPVVNPSPVTVGTGSDALVVKFSEDAFQGDAQFTVSIDGKQLGGTYTETASHALGAGQTFTFNGDWGVGSHTVSVNFLNDLQVANTGNRNLYMDSAVYDGVNTGKTLALLGTGPMTFSVNDTTGVPVVVTQSANDSVVLAGSSAAITDAAGHRWTISSTNTVVEDGKAANFTANVAAIAFVNNAIWHQNTSSQWYDWISSGWVSGNNPLPAPTPPPVPAFDFTTGAGSDTLVLKIAEDAYQGNAQFTVSVDGKQLGGTFTATALHAAHADKTFAFNGDFGTGAHTVGVNFLNDAWGGSSATDRNLYVDAITYKGADTKQAAELGGAGVETFAVSGGTAPSVTETGDHGSLSKLLSQTGSYTVGSDTFVLTAGNAATVTLGTGTSQIKFLGDSTLTLTGGSGTATVTADGGTNKFVAGTGTLDVRGGGGKDAYVFHANGGLLKIEDFASAKGDTLTVDKALQGSMLQASDGAGGTMLTFGAGATHGVDIRGLVAIPANVLWA